MDVQLVRDRLAEAIAAAPTTPPLTALGHVPDAPPVPCVFAGETEVTFDLTMSRGTDQLEVTLRVLVSRADDRTAQALLSRLMSGGSGSIKHAVEAARGAPGERALRGAADDVHLSRISGHRWYEHAGSTYLGCEATVTVIALGED